MVENVHAAVTWYLVGLIWLVQVVQYPMFAHFDRAHFQQAHAFHTSAIGFVVAPPMLLELVLSAWMVTRGKGPLAWAALALAAAIWASTFLVIVPMHEALGTSGFDEAIHRRLVAWNWVRTIAWTLRGLISLLWLRW